jgi:hypothetical protein
MLGDNSLLCQWKNPQEYPQEKTVSLWNFGNIRDNVASLLRKNGS